MAAQTLIPSASPSPPPNPNPVPETSKTESETSDPSTSSAPPSIHHLSFNQDAGCFSVATSSGFRVFNSDPILHMFHRERHVSFAAVEMLFRSSILAIVGGGGTHHQQYPPNKVMIWSDYEIRCIGELSLKSEIRSVRLRRDRIIAVTDRQVLVHNFVDFRLLHEIETMPNPKGLCAVSQQIGSFVLVCLGVKKGQVRVELYGERGRRTRLIPAHDSSIACLELSRDASLVATASSKGTLVRVFSTGDGTLLQEVRRGADRADIYSLAFSENLQYLAVSSDKGTVHVFRLKINLGLTASDTPRPAPDLTIPTASSSLSFIKGVLPKYFSSEWSLAQFRLQEGSQYIVSFGHQKNTVIILGMDGSFYRCEFDPNIGGEMKQLECYDFLKLGGAF